VKRSLPDHVVNTHVHYNIIIVIVNTNTTNLECEECDFVGGQEKCRRKEFPPTSHRPMARDADVGEDDYAIGILMKK
jgi:hypothetical protein